MKRRAPHGARGLKLLDMELVRGALQSRAPHGARGLKHPSPHLAVNAFESRPARGVLRILVRRLERTKYGLRRAGDELHLVEDA